MRALLALLALLLAGAAGWMPPLRERPRLTRLTREPAANDQADARFQHRCRVPGLGPRAECGIAYGSVLPTSEALPADSSEVWGLLERVFPGASAQIELLAAVRHEVGYSPSNGRTGRELQLQLALGGHEQWWRVVLGMTYHLDFRNATTGEARRLAVTEDVTGELHVYESWTPREAAEVELEVAADGAAPPTELRALSFNVWNTNPPHWVFHDPRQRHQRYMARMEHLAAQVREARPDVIALQEVRYDIGNGRSQVTLLRRLLPPEFRHYVFRPAMMYYDESMAPFSRVEEGVAVFSRFPIVRAQHVLLSRDLSDPEDAHQRLCLHAAVDVGGALGVVDVYATHLSLAPEIRHRTMREVHDFALETSSGGLQLLMGDLNEEPHEDGARFLRGDRADAADGARGDWRDAWLELNAEPEPGSGHWALTFPACDPVKRIDFCLFRSDQPLAVEVADVALVGRAPTAETAQDPGSGMLDRDSPIWASDHVGVLTTFATL